MSVYYMFHLHEKAMQLKAQPHSVCTPPVELLQEGNVIPQPHVQEVIQNQHPNIDLKNNSWSRRPMFMLLFDYCQNSAAGLEWPDKIWWLQNQTASSVATFPFPNTGPMCCSTKGIFANAS